MKQALARFADFRCGVNDTDVLDEKSGLTGADLALIAEAAARGARTVSIRQVDLGRLAQETR